MLSFDDFVNENYHWLRTGKEKPFDIISNLEDLLRAIEQEGYLTSNSFIIAKYNGSFYTFSSKTIKDIITDTGEDHIDFILLHKMFNDRHLDSIATSAKRFSTKAKAIEREVRFIYKGKVLGICGTEDYKTENNVYKVICLKDANM